LAPRRRHADESPEALALQAPSPAAPVSGRGKVPAIDSAGSPSSSNGGEPWRSCVDRLTRLDLSSGMAAWASAAPRIPSRCGPRWVEPSAPAAQKVFGLGVGAVVDGRWRSHCARHGAPGSRPSPQAEFRPKCAFFFLPSMCGWRWMNGPRPSVALAGDAHGVAPPPPPPHLQGGVSKRSEAPRITVMPSAIVALLSTTDDLRCGM